jgi:hypothetical protein
LGLWSIRHPQNQGGTADRRIDGRKVGADSHKLLDPKGEQVRDAMGALESSAFGYGLDQWDKQRRGVKTLEGWEICLAQLEALVASAQRQSRDIKEEMEGEFGSPGFPSSC